MSRNAAASFNSMLMRKLRLGSEDPILGYKPRGISRGLSLEKLIPTLYI